MKKLLFTLLLLPSLTYGQGTLIFGQSGTRNTDTAKTVNTLYLPKYATADSNKVLGLDSRGIVVLRTKGAGISLSSLSATTPLVYNSGTGNFSIPQANGSTNGFLRSTDFTTFNAKLDNITGLITDGTNITITGTGTSGDPYEISASGGAPGGANTQVQFNNSSSFGGDAGFTYNSTTNEGTIDSFNAIMLRPDTVFSNIVGRAQSDTAIFFGTSVTAGSDASAESKEYVSLVAAGLGYAYINSGSGGMCLQSGHGSSFMLVYTSAIPVKSPGLEKLFMAWGENDSYFQTLGVPGFDTTNYKTDYQTVVDYCVTQGWSLSDIVIISPFWQLTSRVTYALQLEYWTASRTIAWTNTGITWIDVWNPGMAGGSKYMTDGVHPKDYGHAQYASIILTNLKSANPVEADGQKIASNGTAEFATLKVKNPDSSTGAAYVAMIEPDGKITKSPSDAYVKYYNSIPTQRQTGNVFSEGNVNITGYFKGGTGYFNSATWAFDATINETALMIGTVGGDAGRIWAYNASSGGTHKKIFIDDVGSAGVIIGAGSGVATAGLTAYGNISFPSFLNIGSAEVAYGSSALDVSDVTTRTFDPPNMTEAQRDAVVLPRAGATIYCNDCTATDASTGVIQTYNGSVWKNHW